MEATEARLVGVVEDEDGGGGRELLVEAAAAAPEEVGAIGSRLAIGAEKVSAQEVAKRLATDGDGSTRSRV